jgi:MraZ protein
MFLGEHEHSLDAKQRLAIPSEFRDAWRTERHGESLIAAPGQNGWLWLWPERKFEEHADRIESGLVTQEEVVRQNRDLFSRAAKVPFDSAGRIRIPDRLLKDFGLSGQVVILGVRDHMELVSIDERNEELDRAREQDKKLKERARARTT